MRMFNQPFDGQLADQLNQLLDSGEYDSLNFVVAFAKRGGIRLLEDAIKRFRNKGSVVNAYIGVDVQGTSYEALEELLDLVDSLHVVHVRGSQTFHPKIYQFGGDNEVTVVVGSNNLTIGGLWRNFESSAIITETATGGETLLGEETSQYFKQLENLRESCRRIASKKDIDKLGDLVARESRQRQGFKVAAMRENSVEPADEDFGKSYPVPSPILSHSHTSSSAGERLEGHTDSVGDSPDIKSEFIPDNSEISFWFETRRLTGGSRNQIDLSMKAKIAKGDPAGTEFDRQEEGFMCGFVELFGIDPRSSSSALDITISFGGVDYSGNTIQFPAGFKSNGTWRLLFKGKSSDGKKITDAFRENAGDENYLVGKILEFSRIGKDHYLLDVFPENLLRSFQDDSLIVAYNGSTSSARLFGILR